MLRIIWFIYVYGLTRRPSKPTTYHKESDV
jgi:hypothetical protein